MGKALLGGLPSLDIGRYEVDDHVKVAQFERAEKTTSDQHDSNP